MSEPATEAPVRALVAFLTARLDEDEQAARAVKPLGEVVVMGGEHVPETFGHARYTVASEDGYPRTLSDPEADRHFARHTPDAVLADIAAKRVLIKWAVEYMEGDFAPWNELALRIMTQPYAEHPDYRPEWSEIEA